MACIVSFNLFLSPILTVLRLGTELFPVLVAPDFLDLLLQSWATGIIQITYQTEYVSPTKKKCF